jgi:hypothetical protein
MISGLESQRSHRKIAVPHYLQTFRELINIHQNRRGQLPSFSYSNDEIADYMVDEEVVKTVTDALFNLEDAKSSTNNLLLDEWFVDYDYVKDEWNFYRTLNTEEISSQSEKRLEIIKRNLSKMIGELTPRDFETLLYDVFAKIDDFDHANIQPQSHDGGYEMFVRSTDKITGHHDWVLIQAKHQKGPVTVSQVRELIGTLDVERTKYPERHIRGLMISLNSASEHAIKAAKQSSTSIDFIDAKSLVNLLIMNKIGFEERNYSYPEIDQLYWNDRGFCDDK